MLVEGKPMLRHVLLHLQNLDGNFQYEEMQQDLESFLFSNHYGVNEIWKVLFQKDGSADLRRRDTMQVSADFWNMLKPTESQEGTFPDACIATNFSLNENGDIM